MMPLQLYHSKTKRKEIFTPIHPGQIKMYVCGMTVYDYCHLGHARMLVCFDTIVRALRAMGYQVTYVRNITDIDDKIIQRAKEDHKNIHHLTTHFIQAMHEDEVALNILAPDHEPCATQYIPEMVALIEKLIVNRLAYVTSNKDVYFEVNQFPAYGELSGQDLEKLRAGIRVTINEEKRDPLDFVLWKSAKSGEPSWPSPWGEGRPGWHIECSVMACQLLGQHFDIHGGGMDLLFPHHENEVAQSVGGYGCQFAHTWLHNGFVQINEEKMSKSLGNFFIVRDVLKEYSGEVLRYFLVSSHYRSPINYLADSLNQASQSLDRIYFSLRNLEMTSSQKPVQENFSTAFYTAMADDFNTPVALAVIFDLVREINRLKVIDMTQAASYAKLLVELASVLGVGQQDPETYFQKGMDTVRIDALIEKRQKAREIKDWKTADEVRQQLQQMGIILEDTPDGVKWRQ